MHLARRIASLYLHDDEYVWSNATDSEINRRNDIAEKVYNAVWPDYNNKKGTGAMWLKREIQKWDLGQSTYLPLIIRKVVGMSETVKSFRQFCEQAPAVPAAPAMTSADVAGIPVKLFQKPIRRKYPKRIVIKK
jgi:hypothetical protein